MARFDCAQWRPISTNMGGSLGPNLGLVLHHAVMNGSLFNFFNNPANQVSAHFWVSQSGLIEQYVDTDRVAWHGKSLNTRYVGVETEGCTAAFNYAEPMSQAMVNALANLYGEGHKRHGWPFALSNSDGQPGFGFHRMAVNTACPCDIRLNQRPTILAISAGKPPTPTTPKIEGEMIASTTGNGYWTTTRDGAVYAFGDAQFHGNAMGKVTGQIVGIAGVGTTGYRLLASDGGVFCFNAPFLGRPDRV